MLAVAGGAGGCGWKSERSLIGGGTRDSNLVCVHMCEGEVVSETLRNVNHPKWLKSRALSYGKVRDPSFASQGPEVHTVSLHEKVSVPGPPHPFYQNPKLFSAADPSGPCGGQRPPPTPCRLRTGCLMFRVRQAAPTCHVPQRRPISHSLHPIRQAGPAQGSAALDNNEGYGTYSGSKGQFT